MSSVQTIVLDQYEKTIKVGQGSTVYGSVRPYSVTNKCVWYATNKPDTLFVDRETGYFVGLKVGTALITVYSDENPSIKSFCEVTIEEAIHVSTLWLSHSKMTLKVGDYTDDLCVEVLPDIATNKNVRFESSNSNVAIVYSDGSIKAKSPGTAVITAISEDGGHTATCTVRVVIDEVIIQKDDLSAEIIFTSTNKIWKCIFADMIYNEDARLNFVLNQRVWHNLYVNHPINQNLKTYTDEELKLLYSIDPHGVAIYIESYVSEKYDDLEKMVKEKDEFFKLLFKKEPKYFARTSSGYWYEVDDYEEINDVLSEAETVFGMHPIYDQRTISQLVSVLLDLTALLAGAFLPAVWGTTISFALERVEDYIKFKYLDSMDVNILSLLGGAMDDGTNAPGIEAMFIETDTAWALKFITTYANLHNIISSEISLKPNFTKNIIEYCYDNIPFEINLELKNSQLLSIDEIANIARQY